MIKPADALKLSLWLAHTNPSLFRKILQQTRQIARSPLGRLGYFGCQTCPTLGSFGVFGDDAAVLVSDTAMPEITVSAPAQADIGTTFAPVDVSTDLSNLSPPTIDTSISDTSQTGGGFWNSVGSGLSSIGGAVASVAKSLTSPQVLQSASQAAAAYFKGQATTAVAQSQAAITQAQLARVAAGYSPAPITYQRNPITGSVTPVYASNTGYVPVTGSLLDRLSLPTSISSSSLLMVGGLAVLALLAITSLARR